MKDNFIYKITVTIVILITGSICIILFMPFSIILGTLFKILELFVDQTIGFCRSILYIENSIKKVWKNKNEVKK